VYLSLGASDPLSALIESERDIGGINSLSPTRFQAPCAPLSTGCVSPLRKKVPSDEKVRRFFPTPAGRVAVTIHAPTKRPLVSPVDAIGAQPATTTAINIPNRMGIIFDMVSSFNVTAKLPLTLFRRRSPCFLRLSERPRLANVFSRKMLPRCGGISRYQPAV
jgi:hypothetical protein